MDRSEPAFPQPNFRGLSMRDYFAAQALPAVIEMVNAAVAVGEVDARMLEETVAEGCYEFADAMLKKRAE